MQLSVRREPRLTDGQVRGCEGAPIEVAVAQHAAAGALEHQIIGALPGKDVVICSARNRGSCPSRTSAELLARPVEETRAADARFTARWADDLQDESDLPH